MSQLTKMWLDVQWEKKMMDPQLLRHYNYGKNIVLLEEWEKNIFFLIRFWQLVSPKVLLHVIMGGINIWEELMSNVQCNWTLTQVVSLIFNRCMTQVWAARHWTQAMSLIFNRCMTRVWGIYVIGVSFWVPLSGGMSVTSL